MSDFAKRVGLSKERLASYEYARAPIRHDVGVAICDQFNIRPAWLATGRRPRHPYIALIGVEELKLGPRALFSELFEAAARKHPLLYETDQHKFPYLGSPDGRASACWMVECAVEKALCSVSPGDVEELSSLLEAAVNRISSRFSKIPAEEASLIEEYVERHKDKSSDDARALFQVFHPEQLEKPNSLTGYTSSASVAPAMNEQIKTWSELRERLRALTGKRGAKAALTRHCEVTNSAVSEWLRGLSMPNADLTIRKLLPWVAAGPQHKISDTVSEPTAKAGKNARAKARKGK